MAWSPGLEQPWFHQTYTCRGQTASHRTGVVVGHITKESYMAAEGGGGGQTICSAMTSSLGQQQLNPLHVFPTDVKISQS